MQKLIVDIRKTNVSFNSTLLISMIPLCNKVSSSARGLFVAKVTAHAGKTPAFYNSFSS
jgi:hypothetical protein